MSEGPPFTLESAGSSRAGAAPNLPISSAGPRREAQGPRHFQASRRRTGSAGPTRHGSPQFWLPTGDPRRPQQCPQTSRRSTCGSQSTTTPRNRPIPVARSSPRHSGLQFTFLGGLQNVEGTPG
ncbi:hypothetical protein NDU88_003369 [Pleurodeles waltl]|uniref:Uncharacterized protein n=1 Tax=Pleurodeles waltl TaxID=8319 RepID=A0AAV7T4X3_PLEWA|nr:hypothetical protein NDU88_003369 [Pleurodeles waltl]